MEVAAIGCRPIQSGDKAAIPVSTAAVDTKQEPTNAPARATHFAFQHPVFNVKGGYFAYLRPSEEIGFHFPLGEMFGVTPVERLRNEFQLDPASDDAKLLLTVAQGLRHVREIRPGDSIPREILDGTASWSVEDRHHLLANNRLDLQVWSWAKGGERVIALPQNQEQVAGDPATKKEIAEGRLALASQLGLAEDGVKEIEFRLERVRREIVYIEALRDRYAFIHQIAAGLGRYNRVFGNVKSVEGELGRARALMRKPLDLFNSKFAKVDAKTGQIVALLGNTDLAIELIRENRDDLHFGFMAWDGLIEKWKDAEFERTGNALALIKETYRFLATNYTMAVTWDLAGQRH